MPAPRKLTTEFLLYIESLSDDYIHARTESHAPGIFRDQVSQLITQLNSENLSPKLLNNHIKQAVIRWFGPSGLKKLRLSYNTHIYREKQSPGVQAKNQLEGKQLLLPCSTVSLLNKIMADEQLDSLAETIEWLARSHLTDMSLTK